MNHQKLSVGLWKFRKSNDYSWSRALANKCFRFVCERLADWCFRTYRRWIKGRPASVGGCTTSFCRRLYARCAWRTNVPQLSTIVPHHWPITFCFAFDATWVHSKNWNVHSRRTKGTTHTHTHTGCLRVHSSFHARSLSFVVVVARGALFTPSFAGNRYAKCERTRYINTVRYPFRRQLLFDNVNSSTMPMDPHVVYAVVAVGLSVRIDVLHRMVIFIFTNSLSSFGDVTAHITITHTYTEWHRIYRRQML